MPEGIGGTASAPSPGWLFRAAAASCVTSLIAVRAAVLGIAIGAVEVTVDSESDDRGILGMDESIPAGPLSVRIAVAIAGSAAGGDLDQLVRWAIDHCPVTEGLGRAIPVEIAIDVGS